MISHCPWQLAVDCYLISEIRSFFFKGRGQDYWQDKNVVEEMPCCRQMFNVFHPFDPVAYRFVASLHIIVLTFCLESWPKMQYHNGTK